MLVIELENLNRTYGVSSKIEHLVIQFNNYFEPKGPLPNYPNLKNLLIDNQSLNPNYYGHDFTMFLGYPYRCRNLETLTLMRVPLYIKQIGEFLNSAHFPNLKNLNLFYCRVPPYPKDQLSKLYDDVKFLD